MQKELLRDLVRRGLTQRQIALLVGKSQTTVRHWLDKYNLQTYRIHQCRFCGELRPFAFAPERYTVCRKCRYRAWQPIRSRYARTRARVNKRKAVAYRGGRCEICGYDRCMAALDFHHRDPASKDPNWRQMRNYSFERVRQELDKCMLVCRNCHAEIHYGA